MAKEVVVYQSGKQVVGTFFGMVTFFDDSAFPGMFSMGLDEDRRAFTGDFFVLVREGTIPVGEETDDLLFEMHGRREMFRLSYPVAVEDPYFGWDNEMLVMRGHKGVLWSVEVRASRGVHLTVDYSQSEKYLQFLRRK